MTNYYLKMGKAAAFLLLPALLAAQNYVHQVIVVNEGQYDYVNEVQVTPVSFGTFNPDDNTYAHIADLANVRFASDVEVDEIYIRSEERR